MVEAQPSSRIVPGSHVTFHYRIAAVVDGTEREIVSTFGAQPATLTVGRGAFADSLEACLVGLEEGSQRGFELAPDAGFGARRADLVQSLSGAVFDANADPSVGYARGDIVQFSSPEGRQFSGVLKQRDGDRVVVDFNHPLAGMLIGALAANLVGRWLVETADTVIGNLPLVRSIYGGAKQVFKQVAAPERTSFKQAVLVEFPRPGAWAIGFVTNENTSEVAHDIGEELVAVYVPQAPHPDVRVPALPLEVDAQAPATEAR